MATTTAPRPVARKPLGLGDTWNGLPVYAWVGIGALSVAGLYVFISRYRKAKTATTATSSTSSAFTPGLGNQALPGNQLLEPIIINGGGQSQPLPAPTPTPTEAPSGIPAGDTALAADIGFINSLYNQVLHRAADPGGFNYWLGELIGPRPYTTTEVAGAFQTAAQQELRGAGTSGNALAAQGTVIPAAIAAQPTTQPTAASASTGPAAPDFTRLAA